MPSVSATASTLYLFASKRFGDLYGLQAENDVWNGLQTLAARTDAAGGAVWANYVEVGEGATVLPHSVLLPGSRVGPGETWGGVPARRIEREEMERFKEGIRGMRTLEMP